MAKPGVRPLILASMLTGCAPGLSAGGAGLGFGVENVESQKHQDPGNPEKVYFPVKFACGEAGIGDRLAPASYATVINVINLSKFQGSIGWRFVTVSKTIVGASAIMPAFGSLVMDCPFITANLAAAGVEVSPFVEGFVLIEDLTGEPTVRVSAMYSGLHKQLHRLPDLVPVRTARGYCNLANGRLVVTIKNLGDAPAAASTARISFPGAGTVSRATPALAPGEQVDLAPVDLPPHGEEVVSFTITADSAATVAESSETNNTVTGFCEFILASR